MEIRIGVQHSPKELEVDLGEGVNADALQKEIARVTSGAAMLWMTDKKGRKVGIPGDKIAYVEISAEAGSARRMGFVDSTPSK